MFPEHGEEYVSLHGLLTDVEFNAGGAGLAFALRCELRLLQSHANTEQFQGPAMMLKSNDSSILGNLIAPVSRDQEITERILAALLAAFQHRMDIQFVSRAIESILQASESASTSLSYQSLTQWYRVARNTPNVTEDDYIDAIETTSKIRKTLQAYAPDKLDTVNALLISNDGNSQSVNARIYKRGDEIVPDYIVESFLGEGGYGAIYKVVNIKTGIKKALKTVWIQSIDNLTERFSFLNDVRNPYLLPIEYYWIKDKFNHIINHNDPATMEAQKSENVELLILLGLGDRSLYDRLKECSEKTNRGIPLDELMDYMHDIGKAIDFLNSPETKDNRKKIAIHHGDVKPSNVIMVGNGVQVCDYGLWESIFRRTQMPEARRTTDPCTSTPEYAAPEFVGGKPSCNSDQYSLAITYYELRTGKLPFDDTLNRYACLATDGLDFSLVPKPEQEVLQRATNRQYAHRYRSCAEFVRSLNHVHDDCKKEVIELLRESALRTLTVDERARLIELTEHTYM